jgi:hypothetical protein
MITTGVTAFCAPSHKLPSAITQPPSKLDSAMFANRHALLPRVCGNSFHTNTAPNTDSFRLTSIRALPDDAVDFNERASEHPAFQACDIGKMLNKMMKPDQTQLQHLNTAADNGLKKIDKAIEALKSNHPEMNKRAELLFGDQVKKQTLIEGLHAIRSNLSEVKKAGAYAIDQYIDDCPTEAFTIVQDLPKKQEPFVIFLRGYFFNPPEILSKIYKSKDDYQTHTLIHEATHLALRSYDIQLKNGMPAYSPYGCIALCKEQPERTIDNADSWAWLVS